MNKSEANTIQTIALKAMEDAIAKAGYSVTCKGGTFNESGVVMKFEFKSNDRDTLAAQEKAEFEKYAFMFNLEPSDHGAKFVANGETFKLVGFDMKRRKFPILVEDTHGKRRCFTDLVVDRIVKARVAK